MKYKLPIYTLLLLANVHNGQASDRDTLSSMYTEPRAKLSVGVSSLENLYTLYDNGRRVMCHVTPFPTELIPCSNDICFFIPSLKPNQFLPFMHDTACFYENLMNNFVMVHYNSVIGKHKRPMHPADKLTLSSWANHMILQRMIEHKREYMRYNRIPEESNFFLTIKPTGDIYLNKS